MVLDRAVTRQECEWLDEDLPEGTVLYEAMKCTYGVIGPAGIGATFDPTGDYPFFEVPLAAVRYLGPQ